MPSDFSQFEITPGLKRLIRSKARQVVGKAGLTHSDRSDIEQELWLDLLERWPKFRPQRARSSTFVARVVDHKVALILRTRMTAKRAPAHNGHSLDICCQDADGQTVPRAALLKEQVHNRRTGCCHRSAEENLSLRSDVACVLSKLTADQQQLCQQLTIQSIAKIARDKNLSRAAVYRAVEEVRNHFVETGMQKYFQKSADSSPRNRVCKR